MALRSQSLARRAIDSANQSLSPSHMVEPGRPLPREGSDAGAPRVYWLRFGDPGSGSWGPGGSSAAAAGPESGNPEDRAEGGPPEAHSSQVGELRFEPGASLAPRLPRSHWHRTR